MVSYPPGQIHWPSQHIDFSVELEPAAAEQVSSLSEDQETVHAQASIWETADENIRAEAARMRALEEHEKFLERYTELQEALEAKARQDERKQALLVKAQRDNEFLLQLHKTISEKLAESAEAFATKSIDERLYQ